MLNSHTQLCIIICLDCFHNKWTPISLKKCLSSQIFFFQKKFLANQQGRAADFTLLVVGIISKRFSTRLSISLPRSFLPFQGVNKREQNFISWWINKLIKKKNEAATCTYKTHSKWRKLTSQNLLSSKNSMKENPASMPLQGVFQQHNSWNLQWNKIFKDLYISLSKCSKRGDEGPLSYYLLFSCTQLQ